MSNLVKLLQRRTYTFLNSTWGFTIFLVLVWWLMTTIITTFNRDPCRLRGSSSKEKLPTYCSTRNFRDNIVRESMEHKVAFEPIDVVYTWVNGSDPIWLKKKELWTKRYHGINTEEDNETNSTMTTVTITNSTSVANSTDSTTGEPTEEDETMSNNRYRDSEELRYSLRSLIQNAPWIRHIYLVTDNQIPYWLNLETDRLSIVTHEEIFKNKSHLPVFSSPAIEANLHHIPGLSKKFIYFNDDVFLGAPVVPDDFVSLSGAQKLYMAWEVPKCAPGCSDSWIGDGFCDRACNVSACNFDFPDCINGSNARTSTGQAYDNKAPVYCLQGCPDGWLGDKVCDQRCKNDDCGWDFGDCGIDLVIDNYSGVEINRDNSILSSDVQDGSTGSGSEMSGGSMNSYYGPPSFAYYGGDNGDGQMEGTMNSEEVTTSTDNTTSNSTSNTNKIKPSQRQPALSVPYGTKAVYFNLTYFPCRFFVPPTVTLTSPDGSNYTTTLSDTPCDAKNMTNFKFSSADHDDYQNEIIHQPTILTKLNMLMVTLYHGQENAPMPSAFPHIVTFNVWGSDEITSAYVSLSFKLMITKPMGANELRAYLPGGGTSTTGEQVLDLIDTDSSYLAINGVSNTNLDLLKVPTGFVPLPISSSVESVSEGSESKNSLQQQGVIFSWYLTKNHTDLLTQHHSQLSQNSELTTIITVSLRNNSVYSVKVPLCALLTEFYDQGMRGTAATDSGTLHFFHTNSHRFCRADSLHGTTNTSTLLQRGNSFYQKYLASSLASMHATTPQQNARLKDRRKSVYPGILLSIPIPVPWSSFQLDLIHVKVEIYSSPVAVDGQHNSRSIATSVSGTWRHRIGGGSYVLPTSTAADAMGHGYGQGSTTSQGWIGEGEHRVCYIAAAIPWGKNDTTSTVPVASPVDVTTESIPDSTTASTPDGVVSPLEQNAVVTATNETSIAAVESVSSVVVDEIATEEASSHYSNATSTEEVIDSEGSSSNVDNTTDSITRRRLVETTEEAALSWISSLSAWIHQKRVSIAVTIANALGLSLQPRHQLSQRRRLIDTYAQSLIHVNRMYNKEFGIETRKVPAHVPHMIDRDIIEEMQNKWSFQWNETSSHRFRSSTDMQYSFSYYYYIMHRHKIHQRDYYGLVESVVDKDHDHFLNDNEFRTLLAMMLHRTVQQEDIHDALTCIANSSSYIYDVTGTLDHSVIGGKLTKSLTFRRFPTIAQVVNCSKITDLLKEKFDWSSRAPWVPPVMLPDKDVVAFEMIGDNFTDSLHQLDSIRARQSKFICVNDNMKSPSPELVAAMKEFFEALYPFPSIFELDHLHEGKGNGKRNPTLYVDEYRKWRKSEEFKKEQWKSYWYETILQQSVLLPLKDKLVSLAKITIRLLDDEVVAVDNEEILLRRMERDLSYNPFGTPSLTKCKYNNHQKNRHANSDNLHEHAHIGLFAGVLGLMAVLLLRALVRGGYSSDSSDGTTTGLSAERARRMLEKLEQESLAAAISASQEEAAREFALQQNKQYQEQRDIPIVKRKSIESGARKEFNAADYEQEMLDVINSEPPYFDQAQDDEDNVVRTRYEQGGVDRTNGGLLDKEQYDELLRQSMLAEDDDEGSTMVALAKRWKKE